MVEATAMKKVEETNKPVKCGTVFNQVEETFNALARRAYEIFDGNGRKRGHDLDDWFQAERELLHPVKVNVTETEGTLEVKAEVPGFNEKELEIGVEPRRLAITGKRETSKEQKNGKVVYSENSSDQLLRIIELPAEVDATKAAATLKNGVLEVTLPKVLAAQPVRVQPKAA